MKDRLILHNILIEGVAAEGKAIAHAKLPTESEDATARVMFVEYAVPGDVVDVLVTKRKKNYLEGRVERKAFRYRHPSGRPRRLPWASASCHGQRCWLH